MLARDLLTNINELIAGILSSDNEIEKLYSSYFITKLKAILTEMDRTHPDEPITAVTAKPLVELLAKNYSVTKNTDMAPTVSYHLPHTIACITIAQEIEKIVNVNRYKLLHPEIVEMDYVASGTSLNDDSSELSAFMMSDDGKRIIEIQNCLAFAEEDGILKHTSLIGGQVRPLTQSEIERLLNSSAEARHYWDAITRKVQFETRGESFGAMLTALANTLENGGVHARGDGRGAEYQAGGAANVGILSFIEWFNYLERDEQQTIKNLRSRETDFNDIYNRLVNPRNYSDSVYCVEIISGLVKSIIHSNQQIFNMYPRKVKKPEGHPQLREITDNITRSREAFIRSMRMRVPQSIYGERGRNLLAGNLSDLPDLHLYIQPAQWQRWFEQHLARVDEYERLEFLIKFAAAINTYQSSLNMSRIFGMLLPDQHLELIQMLEATKEVPSTHISDYARYFPLLSDANRELLLSQTLHLLNSYEDLLTVIRNLPEQGRTNYAMTYKQYIDSADKFFNILNELPSSEETFNFIMEFRHYITNSIHLTLAINKVVSPYTTLLYVLLTKSCFKNENELAEFSSNDFSPRFELLQFYYRLRLNNGNDLANLLARESEEIRLFIANHYESCIQTGIELARVLAQLPQRERSAFTIAHIACIKNGAELATILPLLTFPSDSQKMGFVVPLIDKVRSDEELANIVKHFQFNDGCYLMKLAISKSATISNPHVLFNNSLFSTPKNPPQAGVAVAAAVYAAVSAAAMKEKK